jgi:hypothetical protein
MERFRWLVHRHSGRCGWLERVGLLRTLAWTYLFKNYALRDWVTFAEVYGMPLRLGRYKSHSSPDDRRALRDALVSLGSDAAGIIPDSARHRVHQREVHVDRRNLPAPGGLLRPHREQGGAGPDAHDRHVGRDRVARAGEVTTASVRTSSRATQPPSR